MTTNRRYAIPVEDSTWAVRNAFDTVFRWEYEEGRAALMNLYEKGKKLQWNTNARIDWSQDLDPENPQELPDESVSIFGSPMWERLKRLLDDVLSDSRWDMTYLGMQVLIEGLALAAFATIRDQAKNSLAAAVNAYVMQDEARHVAFGRLTLRDYYPQLTQAERDER